jgi:hypothetical protein
MTGDVRRARVVCQSGPVLDCLGTPTRSLEIAPNRPRDSLARGSVRFPEHNRLHAEPHKSLAAAATVTGG